MKHTAAKHTNQVIWVQLLKTKNYTPTSLVDFMFLSGFQPPILISDTVEREEMELIGEKLPFTFENESRSEIYKTFFNHKK